MFNYLMSPVLAGRVSGDREYLNGRLHTGVPLSLSVLGLQLSGVD